MIGTWSTLLEGALDRLWQQIYTYGPGLLAAAVILAAFWALAAALRWVLARIFKGARLDRFLRESGISSMFHRSGRLRATRIVAAAAYWAVLTLGALTALNAVNTAMSARVLETLVLLFPKLATAGLILLAGAWLARYLSRSVLVWACNENLPGPRKLAAAVRVSIVFAAVVVAAEHLDFARGVFLAAFILAFGGAAIAGGLALGLGGRDAIRRYLERQSDDPERAPARSLWNHL